MSVDYSALHRVVSGPYAVVRVCTACRAVTHIRRRTRGAGRGAGFREGNRGNGATLAHWRQCHPDELEGLRRKWGLTS